MPGFIMELFDLRFDDKGYRKSVDAAIQTQMRMAAREWLRAVIPHIPVYTGMSRGSLQPLGRFLKVTVPIRPVATRPGYSIEAGRDQSSFSFTKEGGSYYFTWTSEVLQYQINEFHKVPLPLRHPTPWRSLIAGQKAFDLYARNIIPKRIPRVNDFIKATSIIVRP